MSIGFNDMYSISAGIFSVFSAKNPKTKSYAINHSEEKRNKMKPLFPVSKFNNSTKENFIICNLYINFKESPASLSGLFSRLQSIDNKSAIVFKNEIKNYKKLMTDDIIRISSEESSISLNYMLDQYRLNKIYWFTLYFYIISYSEKGFDIEEINNSRINKKLVENIRKLLLYVSFSKNSIDEMNVLLKDRIAV